jgi:hypothetical protein
MQVRSTHNPSVLVGKWPNWLPLVIPPGNRLIGWRVQVVLRVLNLLLIFFTSPRSNQQLL